MSFLDMSNFLIDTHVFLWLVFSPEKLSKKTRQLLEKRENRVSVSAITFWEISLKFRLGKLELCGVLPDELPSIARKMGIDIANLTADDFASFYKMPLVEEHKDPFDRLIIWQCITQKMLFISHDSKLSGYTRFGLNLL